MTSQTTGYRVKRHINVKLCFTQRYTTGCEKQLINQPIQQHSTKPMLQENLTHAAQGTRTRLPNQNSATPQNPGTEQGHIKPAQPICSRNPKPRKETAMTTKGSHEQGDGGISRGIPMYRVTEGKNSQRLQGNHGRGGGMQEMIWRGGKGKTRGMRGGRESSAGQRGRLAG